MRVCVCVGFTHARFFHSTAESLSTFLSTHAVSVIGPMCGHGGRCQWILGRRKQEKSAAQTLAPNDITRRRFDMLTSCWPGSKRRSQDVTTCLKQTRSFFFTPQVYQRLPARQSDCHVSAVLIMTGAHRDRTCRTTPTDPPPTAGRGYRGACDGGGDAGERAVKIHGGRSKQTTAGRFLPAEQLLWWTSTQSVTVRRRQTMSEGVTTWWTETSRRPPSETSAIIIKRLFVFPQSPLLWSKEILHSQRTMGKICFWPL